MKNKRKRLITRLISLGMSLSIAFSLGLTACANANNAGNQTPQGAKASEVEFWSTYSTDKVLADMPDYYDSIKQAAVVDLTAIRGEEEAAQIIMTTGDKKVTAYDVTVSDLTCGSEVYAKENITVYHQKYINVIGSEYYKLTGLFPDCLVPFENVKKVGENYIEKNNNQGLYISFEIPETQTPGVYTGSIAVTIGGETKTVPVTLEVELAAIGAETHFLSCFQNKWHLDRGELDTSNDILDVYNRTLFEYRLGCSNLLFRNEHTDKEIEYYAYYAAEYSKLPEFSGYAIPLGDKTYNNFELYGRVLNGLGRNFDLLVKYFTVLAYKGLEEDVDIFEKAFIYGRDEPDLNGTADSIVKNDAYVIRHAKENVINLLKNDQSISNTQLRDQICDSLNGIPHVVTSCAYMQTEFDLAEEDLVYCPEFQYLETESDRVKYRMSEDNDLWWYGCCEPDNPYPTYHTDDTVISARLLSWMQADYNIQGNLYWATDHYGANNGENAPNNYSENYYTGDNAARCVRTNGEGYLFYPGKKYGLDGPAPSLRLHQIRDGLEEAEMIMALREVYESVSTEAQATKPFDEDVFMNYVYGKMYSGTQVGTNSTVFAQCRQILIDMVNLAQCEASVCIADVVESTTGYTFKIYAKDGYVLKNGGTEITSKTTASNGYVCYDLSVNLKNNEKLDLSVVVGDKAYGVEMSFGSEMNAYSGEYLSDKVYRLNDATPEFESSLVSALDGSEDQWVKFSFGYATNYPQECVLRDSLTVRKFGANTEKVVFHIYNSSENEIALTVSLEYGNKAGQFKPKTSITLAPGMNTVSLNNMYGMSWASLKYINSVKFIFGQRADAARDCLYLADMLVYKV